MRRFSTTLSLILAIAASAGAQPASPWRFWDIADGFAESYTSGIAPNGDGRVLVKHGYVEQMELLDGYSGSRLPDPGGLGKLEAASDGTVWMWTGRQLKRFHHSEWTAFDMPAVTSLGVMRGNSLDTWEFTSATSAFYHSPIILTPLDRNRVLILLPDRILQFDAARSQAVPVLLLAQTSLTRFAGMRAARDGAIYVTGRGGLGRIVHTPQGLWRWDPLPRPPLSYAEFRDPFEWEKGVLVTAVTPGLATTALGFDGGAWRVVYKGLSETLRVWRGTGDAFWVQDGNYVSEIVAGRKYPAERNGALSGVVISVLPEAPGRFWVTTSQGIAHHMPALWQTPPEAPQIDDVVNAITEDRSGRIWFLSAHHLICLAGTSWHSFPLPKGETSLETFTDGLAFLPNGSIAIRTRASNLLVFDPARGVFHTVRHPEGRRLRLFMARPDSSLLVETFAPASHEDAALESFDGRQFRPFLKPPLPWNNTEIRTLVVASTGKLWVGSTGFFGFHDGAGLHLLGRKDGFDDPGAFYIYQDRKGGLVAGGRDGLFEMADGKWRRLQAGLDRVRSIVRARDGMLWVASGTGIHRYRNGAWIQNGLEEGLPSSVAYKVFEDSRGRIWAGTTRGISLFHPEADTDPPVAMFDARNPAEAPPGGRIRLAFSGNDKWKFTPSNRLLFSHRLDAGAWSAFTGTASIFFDKLPSGPHRIELRTMDRNGNISVDPALHAFTVLLPWYATPGFLWSAAGSTALIALLLTLAAMSYSHRGKLIRELKRRNRVETDSQTILQMMAAREPLHILFQRIAAAVAAHSPGATCVLFRENESSLDFTSSPALSHSLRRSIELLAQNRSSGEWWNDLCALKTAFAAGSCSLAPIRAGNRERLGAIVLFTTRPDEHQDAAAWLDTFSDLAAAAIENARLYDRLEFQAGHDALTGLPNRYYFETRLQACVSTAKRRRCKVAVLYLDLDRFKKINDTLGHRIGDLFLKQVALRLTGALGPGDTLARIGGDEFTILIDRPLDRLSIEQAASEMLVTLRNPIRIEGHELFASASIGISVFPEDGETPSTLQKHADCAMYRAKSAGRNRVESFSADMASTSAASIGIEQLLHRALDQQLFELHYQPQVTLAGEAAGFEALLRLRNSEGGYVSPAEFIPIAEETGLIVPIGSWVLREACRQIRAWMDQGLSATRVAINVSALQIARRSFAEEVAAAIAESRIDPRCLELELTESALMGNLAESRPQMQKLRLLGVRIAVDDFGTGYSSLAYLQNLPIDILKIDRSFVQAITGPSGGLPMVQAILAMARTLGLIVVAEGVETESQWVALRRSSCDYLQGYLFSRPLPATELHRFLHPCQPAFDRIGQAALLVS